MAEEKQIQQITSHDDMEALQYVLMHVKGTEPVQVFHQQPELIPGVVESN